MTSEVRNPSVGGTICQINSAYLPTSTRPWLPKRGPIGFTWPHRRSRPWLLHLPRLGHSLREFLITPLLCMWWCHKMLCVISLQREMYVFDLTGLARHFLWLNPISQLFLSPQPIDKKAEKDISVCRWRKTSCPGSRSTPISHLPWHWQIGYPCAWTNIWCALTGYPHCWFRLRRTSSMPDQTGQDLRAIAWGPCHTNPGSERGFLLSHGYGCDGVVRPDQLDRLVNHLWPNYSQGGGSFTKRRPLRKLPLDRGLTLRF